MTLHSYMITNDPGIARHVVAAGVDMLFVDLESLGKATRQGHLDSWKSPHVPQDISDLRAAVPEARIMVRLNPWHAGSRAEVADVLARGADALMLPMFHDAATVADCLDAIGGQVPLIPLVETAAALAAVPDLVALGITHLHIGLNDLHLDLGAPFMFAPLADGLLDPAAEALRAAGVAFGIGGVARLTSPGPVPARIILGEHARLGSDWVILGRGFHDRSTTLAELNARVDFAAELAALGACHADWKAAGPDALAENHRDLQAAVAAEVARRNAADS